MASMTATYIVAIFYPFSQFCEIKISLLSLQTQPNTAPNLFQRGVEYGKYERETKKQKKNRGHICDALSNIYIYIYICIHVCVIYIYIYIYKTYIYIYISNIYIYIYYTYIQISARGRGSVRWQGPLITSIAITTAWLLVLLLLLLLLLLLVLVLLLVLLLLPNY